MLQGPEWLRFAFEKQILGKQSDPTGAIDNKDIRPLIQILHSRDKGFPALVKGRASYTGELFWYLFFLADLGLTAADLDLEGQFRKVLELEDGNRKFILSKEMKPDYFCISSILLTAMARMSGEVKDRLRPHLKVIIESQRLDGGWHCAKSRAVGQRLEESESCPMDNLNILMLLAEDEESRNQPCLNGAVDLLFEHWQRREERWRPYGFGIGSEFKKLRYPAFKYGILRVLDVLSRYPHAVRQPDFKGMLDFVRQKAESGRYRAESVAKMFKAFDFGQSKEPSRWITFLVRRIEKKADLDS
jgi:hypothetical protein